MFYFTAVLVGVLSWSWVMDLRGSTLACKTTYSVLSEGTENIFSIKYVLALHCHCLVALLDQPPDVIIKIPVAFEELIVCVCK